MPKKKELYQPKEPLVKDVDFYIENGLYVFTEKYHKDRGYCCGNSCRHCPYSDKVKTE